MRKLLFFLLLLGPVHLYGQCPTVVNTIIDVCNDAGGQGTITATFNDGTPPFTYILYNVVGPTAVSDPFGPVTVTELAPNVVQFALVPDGDYLIRVNGENPDGTVCFATVGGFGINVNSANFLDPSLVSVTPSCTPNTGEIDIDVVGGEGPYSYSWTQDEDPAFSASTQDLVGEDPGTYNFTVTDANNCTASVDGIIISVISTAVAGPDQSICVDNTVLSADPAETGETGTWTGPAGVTFSDINDANATVSNLPVGLTTLTWTVGDGICPGKTDEVEITREEVATVDAGGDQTICSNSIAALTGSIGGSATSALWTSSGDGSFGDTTNPTTTYTPGTNDIIAGSIDLTLTTGDPSGPCPAASSTITITIEAAPTADAGSDEESCSTGIFDFAAQATPASVTNESSLAWTHTGAGVIADATTLTPIYTPDATDSGIITFTLTANGNGSCAAVVSTMDLTITSGPTADAGSNEETCATEVFDFAAQGTAATVSNESSFVWTHDGAGVIADATTLTPTYTPDATDAGNIITFTLTATGNGSCADAISTMELTITPSATADAGSDEEICSAGIFDFAAQGTGATVANENSFVWTHDGAGAIADAGTLTPTYTPDATDSGSIIFTLTATGNGSCADAVSTMELNITPAPTADAGSSEETCASEVFDFSGQATAATATNQSSLSWTHDGNGTIADASTLTPTYTPDAADAGNLVTFTLTASGNGSCADATSTMELTITPSATADAGSDEEICSTGIFDFAGQGTGATVANENSFVWTHDGAGVIADANTLTPTYTPDVTDSGVIIFTLTATGSGSCADAVSTMALTITPAPTADAGSSEETCASEIFDFSGQATIATATNQSSLLWIHDGNGTIAEANTLTPTYTPVAADAGNIVTFTLTATGNGSCADAASTMDLTITPSATADAGSDEEICSTGTFDFAAQATGATVANENTFVWTHDGAGVIADAGTLTPTYTPDATDSGTVTFTLTATGDGSCADAVSTMALTITPAPTADAGSDEEICASEAFDFAAQGTVATATNQSSLLWTHNGAGVITDAATLTPAYTPDAADAGNIVIFTLTATGNGSCADAVTTMELTVTPVAIADAGSDEEICSTGTFDFAAQTTAATVANENSFVWTHDGAGVITDAGTLTPSYTPDATDSGTIIFTLTATGDGSCADAVSTMTLNITPAPTADAGSNEEICEGNDFALSASTILPSTTNNGSLTWTTSGDGSFNDVNTLTPTYTPGITDISNGTFTLTLEAMGNGSCASATDDMTVVITPLPTEFTVSGGGRYCAGSPAGQNIDLSGSEIGVDYTLVLEGSDVETIAGTGAALSFTPQSAAGTYTVNAINTATGCIAVMADDAVIAVDALPTAQISGDNSICEGSTSEIRFDLTGTAPWDIEYTDGTSNFTQSGMTVANFLLNVSPGASTTYTVVSVSDANCVGTGSGSAEITVHTNPDVTLNLVANPAGTVCSGGNVVIEVEGSESGVDYQLRNDADDSLIGGAVAGNDGTIALPAGSLAASTTFNVLAISAGCGSVELNNLIAVNVAGAINSGLDIAAVEGAVCENSGTIIEIQNSESGVTYQLRNNAGNALVGAAVPGDGATIGLSTGNLTITTVFNILADNGACATVMDNTVSVEVNANPDPGLTVVVDPVGTICNGGSASVQVEGSESGITYQLRNNTDDSDIGSAVEGNSGTISLPTGALTANTTFNILATGVCGQIELTNTVAVTVAGTIDASLAINAVDPAVCENSGTMIEINNSEAGVDYQLRNDADNSLLGTAITGDGNTISLPTGNLVTTTAFNVLASNGTCAVIMDNKVTVNVDPNPDTGLTVAANPGGSICSGGTVNIEVQGSESGVSYQLRNDADDSLIGSAVAGNDGMISLPTGTLSTSTTFNILAASGSCPSAELANTVTVNVLPSSNPSCGGGGGGTGECATVAVSFPAGYITPATCTNSDGEIIFKIDPFVPAVNNTGVIIAIDGPEKRTNVNDSVFSNLPIGVYTYTIEYGDPACIKTGNVTIDQSGTVGTPVATNVVGPDCYGGNGVLNLDIAGETGNVLQWSLGGSIWNTFVSGEQIEVPAGPAPTYEQVISVRRNNKDLCNAAVTVVIESQYDEIKITSATTEASCDNNDGSIKIKSVTGGSGDYSYRMDGVPFEALPDEGTFTELNGGNHVFTVIDEGVGGCEQDFNVIIPYPGLVNFSTVANDPDCSNNAAANGEIDVVIQSIGLFQVGISSDHEEDPAEFYNVPSDGNGSFTFSDLTKGEYYITVISTGATCPNRRKVEIAGGPAAVSFDYTLRCDAVGLTKQLYLTNIEGDPSVSYKLQVLKRQDDLSFIEEDEIVFASTGEFLVQHKFLNFNREYKLILLQQQSVCSGQEIVYEHPDHLIVPTALYAEIDTTITSLPDRFTGAIEIDNFSGGSQTYFTRIELDSAAVPGQTYFTEYEEVSVGSGHQFETSYEGIPAGRYVVEVTDEFGCAMPSLTARVPLNVDVWIPNIFTPNSDNFNDEFYVRNLPDAGAKLLVTNRWGNEVFRSEDYRNDWKAKGVPDGLYFYKLDINGEIYNGWVQILKGQP